MRLRALQIQFRAEIGAEADSAIMALAVTNAAELTMLAEMRRAAMIRGLILSLIRLEGVARRAVADMCQLAREVRLSAAQVIQPSVSCNYHAPQLK